MYGSPRIKWDLYAHPYSLLDGESVVKFRMAEYTPRFIQFDHFEGN